MVNACIATEFSTSPKIYKGETNQRDLEHLRCLDLWLRIQFEPTE